MSVFFREQRSGGPIPVQLIPSRWSASGFPVNAANSSGVVAFGAGVQMVASIGSSLPIKQTRVENGDKADVVTSPLLEDPEGKGYGLQDFIYQAFESLLYRGNAFGIYGAFDIRGNPTRVTLVDPDQVTLQPRSDGSVEWRIGSKTYGMQEVWHLRRFPKAGALIGRSPIEQYANTIGLALAAERFGSDWFADGATPSAILTADGAINQATAQVIKERFLSAVRGKREPAVLGAGVKYTAVQVAPEESQFLQTQEFTAAQCARMIGPGVAEILGYNTGEKQTYKTREDVALNLLAYTLDPYLVLFEKALAAWTPNKDYVKFDRSAVLRSDLVTRYTAFRAAVGPTEPWLTVNELRDWEDLAHVPWGDEKPTTGAQPATPANPMGPTP